MNCPQCSHPQNVHSMHGCFYHDDCTCENNARMVGMLVKYAALETETKKLIRELHEHHTIFDLHRDVIEAVTDVNRELDTRPER